jgi:hypothetical protein
MKKQESEVLLRMCCSFKIWRDVNVKQIHAWLSQCKYWIQSSRSHTKASVSELTLQSMKAIIICGLNKGGARALHRFHGYDTIGFLQNKISLKCFIPQKIHNCSAFSSTVKSKDFIFHQSLWPRNAKPYI